MQWAVDYQRKVRSDEFIDSDKCLQMSTTIIE